MQYDEEYQTSFKSILRYTVPIVHRNLKGRPAFGSGVLLDIKDRRFVATAFHCLSDAVLWTDGMEISRDNTMPTPRVPILKRNGDEDVDVGFLEIDKGCLIKTAVEHEACTLDQVYTESGIEAGWMIHICGWPDYGIRRLGPSTIERTLEGVMVKCKSADDKFLRFEFEETARQLNERGEWIEKRTPTPKGYSGGGCWGITKSKDDELYVPMKNTKLLAIQSAWDGIGEGIAPLIREWIRVINQHYPDLRNFIRAAGYSSR